MNEHRSRIHLILATVIWGSVGVFRRSLALPSSLISLVRGILGTVFLVGYLLLRRQHVDRNAVRQNFLLLLFSGIAIGVNWIFLFEAFCYTSVATATLCNYLAPTLMILGASFVLNEKLTAPKVLCALVALVGMVLVSGVLNAGFSGSGEIKGILFALCSAILYAGVVLANKKMHPIPALDQTVFQLIFASIALLPYVLFTIPAGSLVFSPASVAVLMILGIVHTGIAYLLYFGSIGNLKAQTVALLGYLDPVLAVVLSAVLLEERLTPAGCIGAVMILGAAYFSETYKS